MAVTTWASPTIVRFIIPYVRILLVNFFALCLYAHANTTKCSQAHVKVLTVELQCCCRNIYNLAPLLTAQSYYPCSCGIRTSKDLKWLGSFSLPLFLRSNQNCSSSPTQLFLESPLDEQYATLLYVRPLKSVGQDPKCYFEWQDLANRYVLQ